MRTFTLVCTFVFLAFYTGFAQRDAILKIQHTLDTLREARPLETMYLHLDKSNYMLGDTIWYKAYVLDGTWATPSAISGVVYVELIDERGRLVQRSRQVLVAGSTHGDFVLDPAGTESGRFTLRAYTRWLQNFGADYFYQRQVNVSGDYLQEWGVDLAPVRLVDSAGGQQVGMDMQLRNLDDKPFHAQGLTVELVQGDKVIDRKRSLVDTAGVLPVDLTVPNRRDVYRLDVVIRDQENVKARFPLYEGLPDTQYDVQFLPESGQWLVDMPQVMGVKVVGADGLGVRITGTVLNDRDQEVATFACTPKGMGRIDLPALPAGDYHVRVVFPDGSQKTYPLSSPVMDGVVLQYDDRADTPGHFALRVLTTESYADEPLVLTGVVRGVLCYGAVLNMTGSEHVVHLPRAHFPEGVVHLSVSDSTGRPLATRKVYHALSGSSLRVDVSPHRSRYGARDSVALAVQVTDSLGDPVQGNFSLAVTADNQYRMDSVGEDIRSRFLLLAELKGHVEDPGGYFTGDSAASRALDDLLLTQGWVRYDQRLLEETYAFDYLPESHFTISGRVTNVFGKPIGETGITLLSTGQSTVVIDTLTNEEGRFLFDAIPPFDTAGFVIQARNKRAKSFNVGVDLDMDTQPPGWSDLKTTTQPNAWFVNLDTMLQRRVLGHREHQRNVWLGGHGDLKSIMLQEVAVSAKRMVKGSNNLNGPGEADQILDEGELLELGERTLLDVLSEKIEGFRLGVYPRKNGRPEYMVRDKKARLVFDGVDLEFFYDPETAMSPNDHMQFLKSYLERYSASDVLGVEIMYSMQYSGSYNSRYLDVGEIMANVGLETVYIEITTRSGHGPFMRKTPGVVHFRPMPFNWPRAFYRPRYRPQQPPSETKDLRATIYWEPMLITDKEGKAVVSFYTADHLGPYTVRMEGLDGEGNFGIATTRLLVAQ